MYLHTTAALWHVRISLGIWSEDTLFFRSTAQAWNAFRTEFLHCFVINWYHSLSSLTVSLFHHWTGKLCHVSNVFQLVLLLFEEKRQEYYQQSHSQVQNEHVPSLDTLQICALQPCSEGGKSWGVSSSSGGCQNSLYRQSCHQSNVCATMFLKLWTLSDHLGSPLNS